MNICPSDMGLHKQSVPLSLLATRCLEPVFPDKRCGSAYACPASKWTSPAFEYAMTYARGIGAHDPPGRLSTTQPSSHLRDHILSDSSCPSYNPNHSNSQSCALSITIRQTLILNLYSCPSRDTYKPVGSPNHRLPDHTSDTSTHNGSAHKRCFASKRRSSRQRHSYETKAPRGVSAQESARSQASGSESCLGRRGRQRRSHICVRHHGQQNCQQSGRNGREHHICREVRSCASHAVYVTNVICKTQGPAAAQCARRGVWRTEESASQAGDETSYFWPRCH